MQIGPNNQPPVKLHPVQQQEIDAIKKPITIVPKDPPKPQPKPGDELGVIGKILLKFGQWLSP